MLKKFYENFAKQNKYSVNVKIVFMNNIKLLSVKSYKNNGLHGIVGSPMVDLYLINVKK